MTHATPRVHSALGETPDGLEWLRLSTGDRPPLVYFPGLIDASFSPKELLKRRVKLFAPWCAWRTVYVVSRRRPLAPTWSMAHMAEDYARAVRWILDQEGGGRSRIDVAGASFGGCVAMQFALDTPQLVRRLVLQQVAARGDPARQAQAREWIGQLDRNEYLTFARTVVRQSYPQRPRWVNDLVALATWPLVLGGQFERRCGDLAQSLRAIDGYDVMARLGEVRVPTLVIAGALDDMVPLALVRETAASLPHARLHVFEDAGHSAQVKHPHEYAQVMGDFLDAPGDARGA
ncbi:MAG: alpha/beta fold hydrolase [Pseudomonadota bacterium]